MSKIEAILGSPPERERLEVHLFVEEGQWGEVNAESEKLMLEIYPKRNDGVWILELHDVLAALQRSKAKLEELYGGSKRDF